MNILVFQNILNFLVCTQNSIGNWIQPFGWTGPCPSFYSSFDSMDDLLFMELTEQKNYASLVSGQVKLTGINKHTGLNVIVTENRGIYTYDQFEQ